MDIIGFIGVYDKTDLLLNIAKILTKMQKKVLIVDTTLEQKTKYVVPAINPTASYITNFEDFDVAIGFDSLEQIKKYFGIQEGLQYDIILVNVKEIKFDNNNLSRIVKIGLPAGGQSVLYSMSNLVISSAVNSFGANTTRAWSAFSKVEAIIWMILTAFGTSVITFVGQNYGAGKKDRVRKSVKIGLVLTASVVAFFSALLYVFCPVFIKLFTQNTEVIDIGVSVLRICAPFYTLYSFTEVLSGAVKGSGEGLMPMIITVFTVCIMRLVWIWTVVPHFCTIQTVTLSYPITWALSSFVLILYYMNYSKVKFQ